MLIIIIIIAAALFFMRSGGQQAQTQTVVYRNAVPPTSNKADGTIGAIAQGLFQGALNSLQQGDSDAYPPEDQGYDDYSDIADGSTDTL